MSNGYGTEYGTEYDEALAHAEYVVSYSFMFAAEYCVSANGDRGTSSANGDNGASLLGF